MSTRHPILAKVCQSIDHLINVGRTYDGLFPSMLDLNTHEMLTEMPRAIPGQRDGDRAYLGSNLIHDQALLKTMYALSQVLNRPDYAEAADHYLQRFVTHCTDTVSGIFPWGEHAYWHLAEDRVGNSYVDAAGKDRGPDSFSHDHLRQTPLWLWEKLYAIQPARVEQFAEGLDNHWVNPERSEYCRHAFIEQKRYYPQGDRSCDFPRHSGFYLFDLAFAYVHTKRLDFLAQSERFLDYWWEKRDALGLLQIESRSPETDADFYGINAPDQTLSLGTSLLEAATYLNEAQRDLADKMRQRATVYLQGFLNAPHDLEKGIFVITSTFGSNEVKKAMPIWGSIYGLWPASYVALTSLCAYRYTGSTPLLNWAEAVGHRYLHEPFPEDVQAPAMDAGLALGLLADLYDVSGQTQWLDGGLQLAVQLMPIYLDRDLPRGASNIDWYESQMGPSFLLHGLARIALLSQSKDCLLEADYTAR